MTPAGPTSWRRRGRLVLALAALASEAGAGKLPLAEYRVHMNVGCVGSRCPCRPIPYAHTCAYDSQTPNSSIHLLAQNSGGAVPMADVQAATSGLLVFGPTATSDVEYAVVLRSRQQPPPVSLVPVFVHMRGEASVSGALPCSATASARVSAFAYTRTASASTNGPPSAGFDLTLPYNVEPDVPFIASVRATTQVGGYTDCGAEGQAVADPVFTVDPTFPWADYFFFEYSPNLAAVFIDGFESGTTELWSEVAP